MPRSPTGRDKKAVRFFLAAVEYLGISVSRFLKREGAVSAVAAPRRRRAVTSRARSEPDEEEAEADDVSAPSSGTSRTVTLKSGGTLTVSASLDIFSLSEEDRGFIFQLIDKLKEYESKSGSGL